MEEREEDKKPHLKIDPASMAMAIEVAIKQYD